jgi:tRNA (cmo5U34)-methyltransferase
MGKAEKAKAGVGDELVAGNTHWKFSGPVVEQFDSHVSRSVPLYEAGHDLVCGLSDFFVKSDSVIYELGSSTGALTLKLARHNAIKPMARFIGLDIEADMVAKAKENAAKEPNLNVDFVVEDALHHPFEPTDLIVAYYTVQFVRPSDRQRLIDKIYNSLQWGGAFILFEKVRGPDARFQDILARLYDDYKLAQGYSAEEILSKSRSLKGVLEPFSTQGNIDMLKRAGFVDIMGVMRYLCFEGFLAIK